MDDSQIAEKPAGWLGHVGQRRAAPSSPLRPDPRPHLLPGAGVLFKPHQGQVLSMPEQAPPLQRLSRSSPMHHLWLQGHFGRECPQNPCNGGPGGAAPAGSKQAPARVPVRDRLCFDHPPSLSAPPPQAPSMAGFSHVDPARRPRESHKMVVAMPALEQDFHGRVLYATTPSATAAWPPTSSMRQQRCLSPLPPLRLSSATSPASASSSSRHLRRARRVLFIWWPRTPRLRPRHFCCLRPRHRRCLL